MFPYKPTILGYPHGHGNLHMYPVIPRTQDKLKGHIGQESCSPGVAVSLKGARASCVTANHKRILNSSQDSKSLLRHWSYTEPALNLHWLKPYWGYMPPAMVANWLHKPFRPWLFWHPSGAGVTKELTYWAKMATVDQPMDHLGTAPLVTSH